MPDLPLLNVENFLAYLRFLNIYEDHCRLTHCLVYKKDEPDLVSTVPIPKGNMLHAPEIYFVCKAFKIDMPPLKGYSEFQCQMDKLYFNEDYPDL